MKNEINNLPLLKPYVHIPNINEVIFVDGSSSDGTVQYIQTYFPESKLIQQKDRGKGSAILQGIEASSCTYAIILDGDLPVSTEEVSNMISLFQQDSNLAVIKASRELKDGGSEDLTVIRRLGARGLAFVTRVLYRVDWSEVCYGFWGAKRSEILCCIRNRNKEKSPRMYPFRKVPYAMSFEFDQFIFILAHQNHLPILEIPSIEKLRMNGDTSLRAFHDGLRTLIVLLYERFRCTLKE